MSHIVTISTEIKDPAALAAACARLGLQPPVHGTTKLFITDAIDTIKRDIQFDNYGGAWGDQTELDKLLQAYGVEKARIEARKQGHSVTEQTLADGSIKLTIQVGGVI